MDMLGPPTTNSSGGVWIGIQTEGGKLVVGKNIIRSLVKFLLKSETSISLSWWTISSYLQAKKKPQTNKRNKNKLASVLLRVEGERG